MTEKNLLMKKHHTASSFVLLVFLTVICSLLPGSSAGQNAARPDPAYQLGLQFERSGDYESALKLFRELYKKNPEDKKYLVRIEENLRNLKRYEELIQILDEQLGTNPGDINVLGKIADAYLKWGKIDSARVRFDEILEQGSNNPFLYTFISNLFIQNRMFEEAISLLQDGRKKLNNDNLFHYDLARLYGWHRKYKASADEYLKIVQNDPKSFQIVEREFMNFPDDSAAMRQVIEAFEDISQMDPDNTQLVQLKANYFLRHRKYDEAFAHYVKLDKLYNAEGKQVLEFAQQAFRNGDYEASAEAYRYIIEHYPGRAHVSDAEFGLAYSFERQGALPEPGPGGPRNEKLSMAVERYKQIISANPATEWAQNAHFRIGEIQFEQLYDLDEAIRGFASAVQVNPGSITGMTALKRLGDCYVVRGDVDEAYNTYERVATICRDSAPDLAWQAQFEQAELHYYRGMFGKCEAIIDTLLSAVSPTNRLYNDILTRSGFLTEHLEGDSAALALYARGELYARQRNKAQAVAIYEDILKRYPESSLSDDCHYQSALLLVEIGSTNPAIAHLEQILKDHRESFYADRAQKKLGEVYALVLKDRKKAMQTFEDFLVVFPTSVFVDDVRAEIRRLEQEGSIVQ